MASSASSSHKGEPRQRCRGSFRGIFGILKQEKGKFSNKQEKKLLTNFFQILDARRDGDNLFFKLQSSQTSTIQTHCFSWEDTISPFLTEHPELLNRVLSKGFIGLLLITRYEMRYEQQRNWPVAFVEGSLFLKHTKEAELLGHEAANAA